YTQSAVVRHASTDSDTQLAAQLDAALDRLSSTGAVVHARIVELPTGREIYSRLADSSCTPASNFKLLTSATGLDLFRADHSFKTYLAIDGDDLWLIVIDTPATGDPRLAKAAGKTPIALLDEWASELDRRG